MSLTFDYPAALWLLLLLPIFFLVGRLGRAYLARPVRNAAIAVRLALLAALILALAQPVLRRPSDQMSVVFAVDRSASVTVNGSSAADAWLQQALRHAGPDDHVGVVDFGADAAVRLPIGAPGQLPPPVPVDPSQTNLAAALHLGTVLLPSDGARRIVVLSDGQANLGDALARAREASTRGVHVDVVPIGPPSDFKEALLYSLTAPPYVRSGQSFDLNAVVESTTAGAATLSFSMDGHPLSQGQVRLRPGFNRFALSLVSKDKGFHRFQATLSDANGTYPQNKTAYAFTVVREVGAVAVVANELSEAGPLIAALRGAGLKVTALIPSQIPPDLAALEGYDALVVVDTPATAFTLDQMQTIGGFAHDLGRGLVFIGGTQAYGQGKYDGTPLGDALPVNSGVPGNLQDGNVALVLVIDKSGSMDADAGGAKKMAEADRSAELAAGLLEPNDDVAVEAFDDQTSWAVPLQKVGDANHPKQIQQEISMISASGGTDIYAALRTAYNAIHQSNARYKHIILMSDGISLADSDYGPLLQKIHDERITLSTIAIGEDADKNLLQMLANRGGACTITSTTRR